MNVVIQKLNGMWHVIVGSCQIRSPFSATQDRALVVGYARRVWPWRQDLPTRLTVKKEPDSTRAGSNVPRWERQPTETPRRRALKACRQ